MKKMKLDRKKQVGIIAVLGTCLLIASLYLGGLLYYGSHFLPKTYVNETDISSLDLNGANEKLKQIDPFITLIEKSEDPSETFIEKISLRQLDPDISYDVSSLLHSQNNILWFTSLFSRKDLSCDLLSSL